jgi:hypothetical protein
MARNLVPLPPGPNTPSAWQLLRYSRSPLAFLEGCAHRYGDDRAVTPTSSRVGSPNNSRASSDKPTRAGDRSNQSPEGAWSAPIRAGIPILR